MTVPADTRILASGANVALVSVGGDGYVPNSRYDNTANVPRLAVLYSGNLYQYASGSPISGFAPYEAKRLREDKRSEARRLYDDAVIAWNAIGETAGTPAPAPAEDDAPAAGSGNLEQAFVTAIASTVAGGIAETVKDDVARHVIEVLGYNPSRIEVSTPAATKVIEGITHPVFERVLALLLAGENVYLWGEAGSGKSTIGEQIAEALDVEFVFHNAVTDIYAQLLGARYLDGEFMPMPLYHAWKNGGALLFFDELDASIAEAFTFLQNGLSNGYIVFPNGETVYRHETCYVLGAGNTPLTGADLLYVGRYQQDVAMIDRFTYQYVAYDRRIEVALAGGDESLVDFVHDMRRAITETATKHIATPRAIGRIHRFTNSTDDAPAMMTDAEALECALTKHLGRDDLTILREKMTAGAGRWYDAFDAVAKAAR